MAQKELAIEVKNFSYAYEGTEIIPVLKNISFSVEYGEFVGIIGKLGAGKTTLCLAMSGIIPHCMGGYLKGQILVCGKDTRIYTPSDLALRTVGMVFQDPEAQFVRTNVLEEVAFGLENLGVPREEILPRVREALKQVGLLDVSGIYERSPFSLSGGQKQRLSIACAIVLRPKILILDEPCSNIDPVGVTEVFEVLRRLKKEGITIIITSHRIEQLAENADRILVLSNGRLIMDGSPDEVFSNVEVIRSCGERVPDVTEATYILKKDYNLAPKSDSKTLPITTSEGIRYFRRIVEGRKKNAR